ncbi:reductase [Streptomyces sp. BR123]|uniref:NAD-dependent epimerase/dehydratase family protein n=1 Tax=Streptomyces sp. BR123 TaxID=2749828 RepID=UPI0015C47EB6|nr:NAD-dependent epimerase/dehydratase family protein [Streptomyces sp. BR123]NXY96559.1 reductase [Streptomyces sp. BR123]
MRNVCVIGGSRYFGRHLVELLRVAGTHVTVVNRGSAPAPQGVHRLVADRGDERQLRAVLGSRTFDVVVDQVCYTPEQAAVARRVFAGRTGRYVMTSTVEVYDPATNPAPDGADCPLPVTEDVYDPVGRPAPGVPAGTDEATAYAEGKRQAESVLLTDPVFPAAVVRTAHVLGGGRADFTGRLAHYTDRISAGEPVLAHRRARPTTFIHHREIAEFLHWTAGASFTGPVNACAHGTLTVTELGDLVAERVGRPPHYIPVEDGATASPFSYDRAYPMDNGRATRLGFAFSRVTDWMPQAIDEALAARTTAVRDGGTR